MPRTFLAALATAGCAAAAACDDAKAGDPFPVGVRRAGGAFVVDVRADDGPLRTAVLDIMAPVTVLDQDPTLAPVRHGVDLDLLAPRSPADPTLIVRTRFAGASVLELHPCDPAGPCTIGAPGAPVSIGAVIGGETLRGNAITFEPAADRIFVLPDVAGNEEARSRACEVLVSAPFYGGGTLRIGDTEVGFAGTRVALGVCLSPDPTAAAPEARGVDAALVLSTGVGISILGRSRYDAWARATGGPAHDTLPPATALLTQGPIDGRLARIDRFAIVGTDSAPPSACQQVYGHHLMAVRDCTEAEADGVDCPCEDDTGDKRCQVAAVAELAPADPIEFVVVPDEHPLLQALRAELRPEQPEVDGILGVDALATTSFDVDYPNNRLLIRCVAAGCVPRPKFINVDSRQVIAACVAAAPGP